MESCKDCHNCAFDLMCTYMGDWWESERPVLRLKISRDF